MTEHCGMSDLRSDATQAIARDRYFRGSGEVEWDHPATEKVYVRDAEAALDVLLDFLGSHADLDPTYDRLEDVIAALRVEP